MPQGQNQQGQSGGNQGNRGGQPRQTQNQKPPRPKCPQCGHDNDNAVKHCANCGKPLMVTCKCGATVKNTACCTVCGVVLNPAPAAPGAKPKDDWALEVTPVGSRGQYSLAIQATKGGKGTKAEVYVLQAGNCQQHKTSANGFLTLTFTVTVREMKLGIGIVGTQKNLERPVTLYGVPPKIEGDSWGELWDSFKKRLAYWRS